MIILVNNKKIMGVHINKPLTNVIGWVAIAILIGLSATLLFLPLINK
jgi:Mn2+/Fe2+ NRAMP family transporter